MPTPGEVARFHAGLAALGSAAAADGPVGVALSGGPDSTALLVLAHAAMPGRVHAATFDHGLRAESAAEAAIAAESCRMLGVPHAILRPAAPIEAGRTGIQAAARRARYAALQRWCSASAIGLVLTGHHAGDQAETVLLRLARGAGLAGLAAIRPTRPLDPRSDHRALLGRPLLRFTRGELGGIARRASLPTVHDPSNADPRFDRTMARALLARTAWLRPERLAAIADHARAAEEALAWSALHARDERVAEEADGWHFEPGGLPHELVRRIVVQILGEIEERETPDDPRDPDGPSVDRLIETLRAGGTGTLGHAQAWGGAVWRFDAAPPRRDQRR